jgi:hypothetical protein
MVGLPVSAFWGCFVAVLHPPLNKNNPVRVAASGVQGCLHAKTIFQKTAFKARQGKALKYRCVLL